MMLGCAVASQAQNWTYAFEEGSPSPGASCIPLDATTGSVSNFFAGGSFNGNVTFGSTVLSGSSDGFLSRINGLTGVAYWAVKITGGGSEKIEKVEGVGVDVFVYGSTSSTSVTLYSVSGASTTLSLVGIGNGFLAKYNSSGTLLWAVPYAGLVSDMAYNSNLQRIYTVGKNDVVSAKTRVKSYNGSTGALLYDVASINTGYSSANKGIGTDATGNCYILAEVSAGTFSVPTQPSTVTLAATGQDMVLMKLDPTLSFMAATMIGNPGTITEAVKDIDCSGNNIYITGMFSGTTYMDGTTSNAPFNLTSSGGADVFLAKYTPSLTVEWATKIGGTGDDACLAMSLDPNAHPFLLMQNKANNSVAINPCPLAPPYTSTGGFDNKWYMVKYLPTGAVEWTAAPQVIDAQSMPVACQGLNSAARVIGYCKNQTDFGSYSVYGNGSIYVARAEKLACKAATATGIEENGEALSLDVFPNPTTGMLTVPLNADDRNVSIRLSDNLGRLVLNNDHLEASQGNVNLDALPAGVYFYTIVRNQVSYKGKVVKQ